MAGAVQRQLAEVQGFWVKGAAAAQADETPGIAVEFDDVAAAGFLVEIVHILGDDGSKPSHFFQFRQGVVAGVGSSFDNDVFQFPEEFPDLGGVAEEGLNMGVFHGIVAGPEAVGAPEAGNAAFH